MIPLADRLTEQALRHGPLCLGIDPFVEQAPRWFGDPDEPLFTIAEFCSATLEAAAGRVACVKPQLALFERFGPAGYALCAEVCAEARARGLIVILDAKRGDIASSAAGYADASFGANGFDADVVTVNPWMGLDTLEPFVDLAAARGRGVAVLVRTSNPGAGDVQELDVGGAPVALRLAERLAALTPRLLGASGWSGLMAVVGATAPEAARAIRAALPNALFLTPGYGAQGADAGAALAGFRRGPRGLEGGVVNASRSVLYAPEAQAAGDFASWRAAIVARIEAAQHELRAAGEATGPDPRQARSGDGI